jgi:vancomycin resistance protein YoaR
MNKEVEKDSSSKKEKSLNSKIIQITSVVLSILILLAILSFGTLEYFARKYTDASKPSQSIYGHSLSGLSKDELNTSIKESVEAKFEETLKLDYQTESYTLTYHDLGVIEDAEIFATQVAFYDGKPNHSKLLKDFFAKNTLKPSPQLSSEAVLAYVEEQIPGLEPMVNAHFDLSTDGEAKLVEARDGVKINSDKLLRDIKSRLLGNESGPILIETEAQKAEIQTEDIADLEQNFLDLVSKDLLFTQGEVEEVYSLSENPSFIQFAMVEVEVEEPVSEDENSTESEVEEATPTKELKVVGNHDLLAQYTVDVLKPQIDQDPIKIKVDFDPETEEVTFSDDGLPALVVDLEGLQEEVDLTLDYSFYNNNKLIAKVPVIEIDPAVEIAPELQARGIKEIITSTYTTYYGSTYARMTNINVGSAKFNGMIISQGEEFSFNDKLGRVDGTTGFVPELVIKSDGTKPEYGGGLCQVSSTFYRAALDSGIEIIERYPHSYAVSYYAQVMGHGLDATIYPGVKDVKIVNNTPGDILLQTFTDGPKLYYRIYGTKTKEVAYDGPYLSNYTSPGKAQEILKPELEPGYRKQVEVPHTGFNAVWYVTTTDIETGETTEETINTRYQAIPAKFIVGPDAAEATEGEEGSESSSTSEEEGGDSSAPAEVSSEPEA